MSKSMRLKNFKAYKDSGAVPLAPLTVIVGANNSGKSTLFHALLALVQTTRGADQGWAPCLVTKGLVDLNGFNDVVHKNGRTRFSSFEFSVDLDAKPARTRGLIGEDKRKICDFPVPSTADISFSMNDELNEIWVDRSILRTGNEPSVAVERRLGRWVLIAAPANAPTDVKIDFINVFPYLSIPNIQRPAQEYKSAYAVGNFCASLWAEIFKKQVNHVGPLRMRMPWNAGAGARINSEFDPGGENLLADLGSKEKDRTGRTRLEIVNEWLGQNEILKRI